MLSVTGCTEAATTAAGTADSPPPAAALDALGMDTRWSSLIRESSMFLLFEAPPSFMPFQSTKRTGVRCVCASVYEQYNALVNTIASIVVW